MPNVKNLLPAVIITHLREYRFSGFSKKPTRLISTNFSRLAAICGIDKLWCISLNQ